MRNSWKVARWEIKRNLKNKSFLISLFLTPVIIALFALVPGFLAGSSASDDDGNVTTIYLNDELGVYEAIEPIIQMAGDELEWSVTLTDETIEDIQPQLVDESQAVFIHLDESAIDAQVIDYYATEDVPESFAFEIHLIEQPIRYMQLEAAGLSEEEIQTAMTPIMFNPTEVSEDEVARAEAGEQFLSKFVPGIVAGLVLFSIAITGMMAFQSASSEKKEKVAEIVLSSISPEALMQGKIIGYFFLGILQVAVWFGMAAPVVIGVLDFPVVQYLFVPELALLLLFAVLGYLMFATIFVGLGATLEDQTSSGNFQGFIFMLPFLPFIFIAPIVTNPDGVLAQVLSYIPFTSPGIMILRLSILDEWPWVEIIISLAVLIIGIWLLMKLAGKIFKVGILIYGKNSTLPEIWKWIRS